MLRRRVLPNPPHPHLGSCLLRRSERHNYLGSTVARNGIDRQQVIRHVTIMGRILVTMCACSDDRAKQEVTSGRSVKLDSKRKIDDARQL